MSLGRFRLEGIPPAPRGVPQVEVTFDIDANGILHVAAKDKATSKEQKVTITASTNLSKDEIERKVREAREHETDDRRQRELIEARNNADNLAYQTEKMLRELGDKVPASERQDIESKVAGLRELIKGSDTETIRRKSEELNSALHALSQQMHAQQSGGAAPEGGEPKRDGEGEVFEGEFREA